MITEKQKEKVNQLLDIIAELSEEQLQYLKSLIEQAKTQRITLPYKFTDIHGTEYIITVSGHCYIHLPKAGKRKERKIGRFDFYTKTLIKEERKPQNAFFYSLKGFGMPYYLIQFLHQAFKLQKIRIEIYHHLSASFYEVDVETFFDKGIILNFNKKKGMELRIYLPLEHWKKVL